MALPDPLFADTLTAQLDHVVDDAADRPCLIDHDSTRSYGEFSRDAAAAAHRLMGLGVRAGDRVAVLEINSADYVVALYALARIGALMVPLNFRLTEAELAFQLGDSGSSLLLVGKDYLSAGEALSRKAGIKHAPLAELLEAEANADAITSPEAGVLAICYTSGTTGRPKGASINQAACMARAARLVQSLELAPGDCIHPATPMFHISCLNLCIAGIALGATVVLSPQFRPAETLDLIAAEKISVAMVVPTMIDMLLRDPAFEPAVLAGLRQIMYGGSAIGLPLLRELLEVFDGDLVQTFGQTEDLPLMYLSADQHRRAAAEGDEKILTSIGLPCPGVDLGIRDSAGNEVESGQTGELVVASAGVMSGYWGLAEASGDALRDSGLWTGDLGYRDRDGFVFIAGRSKEMILRGGENVYPAEVEAVLNEISGVRQAVVVGLADARWGEIVAAVIRRDSGDLGEDEICSRCRSQLAAYKCPEVVVFKDELPLNAAGKVMRHVLRDILEMERLEI